VAPVARSRPISAHLLKDTYDHLLITSAKGQKGYFTFMTASRTQRAVPSSQPQSKANW
jgi:hypothetical protein